MFSEECIFACFGSVSEPESACYNVLMRLSKDLSAFCLFLCCAD